MSGIPEEIVREATVLFDDTRVEAIDIEAHADFVIARVLDRGTTRSVTAMIRHFGLDRIRDFFLRGGVHRVSRRTAPLWCAYLGIEDTECAPKPWFRSKSRFWTE